MKTAVLIPCFNEEKTISAVVQAFMKELPQADIYVFDNNSSDNTGAIARENGAAVKFVEKQGKGNVVREMFNSIDADIYIMVDGDDTYPAEAVHRLIEPIKQQRADMVIGDRLSNLTYKKENKRPFHNLGNNLVRSLINTLFDAGLKDIMTGYRAFSRKFVKTMPISSEGFEIETEMTLHALDKNFTIHEIPITYRDRPDGSVSKLNTFRDGFRVIQTILWIFRDFKPFPFFTALSGMSLLLGLICGFFPLRDYIEFHYVYKVPLATLASGLVIVSLLFFSIGIILHTVTDFHRQNYQLFVKYFMHIDDMHKKLESDGKTGQ